MKITKEQRDYILDNFCVGCIPTKNLDATADGVKHAMNELKIFLNRHVKEDFEEFSLKDEDSDWVINISYDRRDDEYPICLNVQEGIHDDSLTEWISMDNFKKLTEHFNKILKHINENN